MKAVWQACGRSCKERWNAAGGRGVGLGDSK